MECDSVDVVEKRDIQLQLGSVSAKNCLVTMGSLGLYSVYLDFAKATVRRTSVIFWFGSDFFSVINLAQTTYDLRLTAIFCTGKTRQSINLKSYLQNAST